MVAPLLQPPLHPTAHAAALCMPARANKAVGHSRLLRPWHLPGGLRQAVTQQPGVGPLFVQVGEGKGLGRGRVLCRRCSRPIGGS